MDLYAVRVVKKDQDKILLKVYEVYQDGEERPPQPDPKFMLSVIAEELGPMNKRLNLLPPLAQEIIRNKPFKNASEWEALSHFTGKLMQLRPLAYITSVVTLEENTPPPPPKGIFHWKYNTRTKQFKDDESKIPWALFEVTLSNAAWADHLKEGTLFGTASYFD